jgi:hypothetical protein
MKEHIVTRIHQGNFKVYCSKEDIILHFNYAPKRCPHCGEEIKHLKLRVKNA